MFNKIEIIIKGRSFTICDCKNRSYKEIIKEIKFFINSCLDAELYLTKTLKAKI